MRVVCTIVIMSVVFSGPAFSAYVCPMSPDFVRDLFRVYLPVDDPYVAIGWPFVALCWPICSQARAWLGLVWFGVFGLPSLGLVWCVWRDLAWLGLVWLGLAWFGLAWRVRLASSREDQHHLGRTNILRLVEKCGLDLEGPF